MHRFIETLRQIADLPKKTNEDDVNSITESYYWAVFMANEVIEEIRNTNGKIMPYEPTDEEEFEYAVAAMEMDDAEIDKAVKEAREYNRILTERESSKSMTIRAEPGRDSGLKDFFGNNTLEDVNRFRRKYDLKEYADFEEMRRDLDEKYELLPWKPGGDSDK